MARKNREPRKPQSFDVGFWTLITGVGTCLAAVLAGVAASIFWLQLDAMNDEGRAWVGAMNPIANRPDDSNPLNVVFGFVNTGKEPALKAEFRYYFDVIPMPKGEKLGQFEIPSLNDCKNWKREYLGSVFPTELPTVGAAKMVTTDTPTNIVKWTPDMDTPTTVVRVRACLTYLSRKKERHTSFCYLFPASIDVQQTEQLHIVTCGMDAD